MRTATDRCTEGPFASVIVVCANAERVLGRCIEQLLAQDYPRYELIVVDDASTDRSAAVADAAAREGALRLVRSERNRGCPGARNLGLRHARGEIVAFVDADGFAAPDWLSEVVAVFGDDQTIGGVASTVFFDRNPLVINGAGGTVNRQGWAADLAMNESYEHAEIAAQALYPMGCGMAIRREALERVGSFDERMHNYYDDVDYGVRLWRAGYRVVVAPEAWIDHGSGDTDDEEDAGALAADGGAVGVRKRLLCERHRMRVVLSHAPARTLARWSAYEARELSRASAPVRVQKLKSIVWNARHLGSVLACRRRLRGSAAVPFGLLDDSWGDGFPIGVAERLSPSPQRAGSTVAVERPDAERQLLYGWFPLERVPGRSYRWAGVHAAVFVHLDEAARRIRLDYAHVPVDIGGIDVRVRRVDSTDPQRTLWSTSLRWQYIARSVENHPLTLPAGDYEVVFTSARGWSDPPAETRSLALALSELSFARSFDLPPGGLEMRSPGVEQQLVRGWFEPEESPDRSYRWACGNAAAVVRLDRAAHSGRLSYRLPPASIGGVRLTMKPLGEAHEAFATRLAWRDAEWREEAFALELDAGDYIVSFDTEAEWSNPVGSDAELWPEKRSLGLALSSLTFSSEAA
ncbi:MAG TPA: glycosyltransferase family 2 protein [Solirubrobacteraceae bacterium]|nr:glycosyltransferase family 2 protein [Solirubrobacteraceae bacterium]